MKKLFFSKTVVLACLFIWVGIFAEDVGYQGNYYCTSADAQFFPRLVNLIGSIHAVDFDDLVQIAVFDLGMTQAQINRLKSMRKVYVYQLEKVHTDILTPFKTNNAGRKVRGWFSWKPVALKQALDMFPYVLYVDAGITILRPTKELFKHIQQNGYFFVDNGWNIVDRMTQPVMKTIVALLSIEQQEKILNKNTTAFEGGFQGVSRRMYTSYVMPIYNLASHLDLFADDGSASLGYGEARHDQTLFNIYAHSLNPAPVLNAYGWTNLIIDGKVHPVHMHWDGKKVIKETVVYVSRDRTNLPYYEKCIRYR